MRYINHQFHNTNSYLNNTNDASACQRQPYVPCTPSRGGLLTMIHSTIQFLGNITKMPTPINLSRSLPLIICYYSHLYAHPPQRHPLNSWDEQTITHNLLNYPLYHFLMVGDFKEDIFLGGHLHHGTHTSPTPTNLDWHHFTKHLPTIPCS